jgi:hypothetical protein
VELVQGAAARLGELVYFRVLLGFPLTTLAAVAGERTTRPEVWEAQAAAETDRINLRPVATGLQIPVEAEGEVIFQAVAVLLLSAF